VSANASVAAPTSAAAALQANTTQAQDALSSTSGNNSHRANDLALAYFLAEST
jgi:hypothetical protein